MCCSKDVESGGRKRGSETLGQKMSGEYRYVVCEAHSVATFMYSASILLSRLIFQVVHGENESLIRA